MHLTVLGSGTLLPNPERHSAAHHVRTDTASVLLDCGSGTVHGLARHGIDWRALTHIAITHFHSDHVGDLSGLMFALRNGSEDARDEILTLVGPRGFRSFVTRAADVLGPHLLEPGRPLRIEEVDEGRPFEDDRIRLEACPTPHNEESIAYGVVAGDRALGYTGDTGPSDTLSSFMAGVGALVCACAVERPGARPGHLSPEDVAGLATVARPDVLVLTHVYPPMTPEEAAGRVRAMYPGRVVAARDGLRVVSGRDGWAVDPAPDPV